MKIHINLKDVYPDYCSFSLCKVFFFSDSNRKDVPSPVTLRDYATDGVRSYCYVILIGEIRNAIALERNVLSSWDKSSRLEVEATLHK